MCFGSQRPFFRKYYPYSGRQAQYACIPRRQPEAGGSPLNAVSTVPVGRQVMPGDARKGGATMNVIAYIRNDFQEKFGIPRQSGVVETALSEIVFEPDYRSAEALRGLEGNARVGVFASRSPFRPNPLGLSAVKLEDIVLQSPEGPLLRVSGADLLHGTPILDIKPYLPYADCIPQATGGFAGTKPEPRLEVSAAREVLQGLPAGKWKTLREVLALDPRPSYQDDPERIYGFAFAGRNVRFQVNGSTLEVLSIDVAGEKRS